MRKFLIVAVLLAFAAVASAVNFTIDLTNAQINTIQWKYNSLGGAGTGPDDPGTGFATPQLWFANQVDRLIGEWRNQKLSDDRVSFCQSFVAASTANKNAACTAIGQPTGCNPCQ